MNIFTKILYFSVKWLLLPIVICVLFISITKDVSAQVCIGSRVVDLGTGCNASCQQTYDQISTSCSSFPFCDVTLRFEACISDGPGLCHVEDQFRIYECWEASPTSGPGTIDCGSQTCNSSTEQCCSCGCKAIGSDCAVECGGSPTATPVPAFTCSNFVSGSITPNTEITPGGTVTVQCNFGAVINCITPGGSLTGCTYIGMSGTTASFTCNAPLVVGSYVNYCALFVTGSGSPGCPTSSAVSCADGSYTVGILPTLPPVPTPTTALPTATPTPAYDKQLHIRGSVVANIFNLLRDLGSAVAGEVNDLYPGEFFEYGTEQVIAFPPFLRFRPTLWTETSP